MWHYRFSPVASILCAIALLSLFLSTTANAQYLINGKPYWEAQPRESLTATFAVPDGGVTVNKYSNYTLISVTGIGQSYADVFNDAFYLFTGPVPTPQNGHNGGYYQLAFGAEPLTEFDARRNVKNFLYGELPSYNPEHEYTFILNTGLATPGKLHFGVSDGGYNDNTGQYNIRVTQLAPTPEPSAILLGLVGVFTNGVIQLARRAQRTKVRERRL